MAVKDDFFFFPAWDETIWNELYLLLYENRAGAIRVIMFMMAMQSSK